MNWTKSGLWAAQLGILVVGSACGDIQQANGELGNMTYTLHTDYVMSGSALDEVSLLVGHEQRIHTLPTNVDDYAEEETIRHEVTPSEGVTVVQGEKYGDGWDFGITVDSPGTYTFETWKGSQLHDYIDMVFDAPSSLDLIGWARAPWETEFEALHEGDAVVVGTQVAFLPVPIDANGDRIAGDLFAVFSASDASMIVPGANVYGVYEQGVYSATSTSTVYFVDAGQVDLTLTDEPNAVSASWSFEISESGE